MSWYRWEVSVRLENGVCDGSRLQLVTVCLSDEDAGEISDVQRRPVAPALSVLTHLRLTEARALAFELAGLAERRSGER